MKLGELTRKWRFNARDSDDSKQQQLSTACVSSELLLLADGSYKPYKAA